MTVEGVSRCTELNMRSRIMNILRYQSKNGSCHPYARYGSLRFSSSICFSSSAIRTRYASLSRLNRDRYSSCATR